MHLQWYFSTVVPRLMNRSTCEFFDIRIYYFLEIALTYELILYLKKNFVIFFLLVIQKQVKTCFDWQTFWQKNQLVERNRFESRGTTVMLGSLDQWIF